MYMGFCNFLADENDTAASPLVMERRPLSVSARAKSGMFSSVGEERALLIVLPALLICTYKGSELGFSVSVGRLEAWAAGRRTISMLLRRVDGTSCSSSKSLDCGRMVLYSV